MVLPSITNVDRQLDIALEILRRSPIPWSTDVDQLITKTLQLEGGRRNEEFKEQYELMRLKKMLLGYGVKEFNVSDVAYAKRMSWWWHVA